MYIKVFSLTRSDLLMFNLSKENDTVTQTKNITEFRFSSISSNIQISNKNKYFKVPFFQQQTKDRWLKYRRQTYSSHIQRHRSAVSHNRRMHSRWFDSVPSQPYLLCFFCRETGIRLVRKKQKAPSDTQQSGGGGGGGCMCWKAGIALAELSQDRKKTVQPAFKDINEKNKITK